MALQLLQKIKLLKEHQGMIDWHLVNININVASKCKKIKFKILNATSWIAGFK
jgi:hypothetical protein